MNRKEYILVAVKAEGTHETGQFHILDAQCIIRSGRAPASMQMGRMGRAMK